MLLTLLLGCVPSAKLDQALQENAALQEELAATNAELAMTQGQLEACSQRGQDPGRPHHSADARIAYDAAMEHYAAGELTEALNGLRALSADYPNSYDAKRAERVIAELEIIGTPELPMADVEWMQGSYDRGAALTFLVFFEQWCPHCRREVPALQATHERYAGQGLQIVGLTRLSKSSTRENTQAMLQDNGVSYAVAIEGGALSSGYGVSGIPALVVLQGGEVIWRGHPARVEDAQIEAWLSEGR